MKETTHHPFYEAEPTVREALGECIPTADGTVRFIKSLFPCLNWLPRYNWRWLVGDSIAGFTVGLVVIPQAMAYALLATLPPDFGLYTSFAGAATYWLFGTSKDIVIGTTAVGSLLVGEVISHVHEAHPNTYSSVEIAKTLSFITGLILFAIGLLRLGWIVEVIPYIPVSAFITAASIIIMCTQLPVLLGIPGVNTREEPYKVLISTFRKLGDTKLDAAIGITCLVLLELAKFVFAKLEARQPARKRLWSIMSSLRLTFAMLLYTLVSFIVNRHLSADESKFKIVGHIEQGFVHVGPPSFNGSLIGAILPQSPIILIILIVEHIAIAKSFGKKVGYEVAPSQEIMAQGTANILGPFLGGYSCTGSFGASAVLSKAGVRTPLAGLFSAFMLLLALYALTGVFYFIPRAALAGLIIHAVFNLVAPPSTVLKYWRLSPFECMIWVAGVVIAIFTGLETAIYVTTGLSFLLLLIRIARTKGQFLGKVTVQEMDPSQNQESSAQSKGQAAMRELYLDLARNDASNRDIVVETPHGGALIYHFPEGLNYLNQAQHLKTLTDYVYTHTKRPAEESSADRSEALWCDKPTVYKQDDEVPELRAIVIDCSTIHNIDITSVQGLVDVRNALDRWASPSTIEWHFGGLHNRWARRALAAAGFGRSVAEDYHTIGSWAPVLPLAGEEADGESRKLKTCADDESSIGAQNGDVRRSGPEDTLKTGDQVAQRESGTGKQTHQPVFAIDRPFFHADLGEAVSAALAHASRSDCRLHTDTETETD
ncbi:Putative sulfate permease II [Fusarium acuminatum]|uniref:Sulfate permease II n=1 Tax=Fusarium acuminatum TaxID=5515 RepID=A0ABZ2X2R5_9HYPO